jgi:hypothetical protein
MPESDAKARASRSRAAHQVAFKIRHQVMPSGRVRGALGMPSRCARGALIQGLPYFMEVDQ